MSVLDDIMKQKSQQIKLNLPANMQGGGVSAANGVPANTQDPAQTGFASPKQVTVENITNALTTPVTTQPAPAATAPVPPAQPQQLSYVDMLNKMYTPETPEEKAKRERKEKWDKTAAAIGDGISALANLYYTTKGAPNSYDGKNSMSERTRQLYDKLDKDRKENDRWYLNYYMNAAKMDEDAKRYADERDYKRGRDAVADQRYEDGKKRQETLDEEARQQRAWQNKRQTERDAVQDANTQWQHTYQEKQAARQQANADRTYNMHVKNYERQMEKENPTVGFALGNGRKANIKKQDINPENVSYVYNKLPKEIKDQYAQEQAYDSKGKPAMTWITDESGKRVQVPVMKARKLDDKQMMVIIGEHIANYPEVQNAWKEIGGEITVPNKDGSTRPNSVINQNGKSSSQHGGGNTRPWAQQTGQTRPWATSK